MYILTISACGVSALHYQCMWDGVPRGGTWISPHGGTLAAFVGEARGLIDQLCAQWPTLFGRLPALFALSTREPSDGRWRSMTSQSFSNRVAWHEFGALSQDSFERLKSEKVALRERCRKSARGSRAR